MAFYAVRALCSNTLYYDARTIQQAIEEYLKHYKDKKPIVCAYEVEQDSNGCMLNWQVKGL